MAPRRYQTAYLIAKIMEVLSWLVLAGGILAGVLVIASGNLVIGLGMIASAIVFGSLLVFSAQLTLIFIDLGNNTDRMVAENLRTNAMLAETLGSIAANVNKIAQRDNR